MARNRVFIDRFHREAKLAAHLTQDNLVRVYDTLNQFGLYYTIMEFVDGENLTSRVERRGPLRLQESLSIFLPALKALAALHQQRIVHRDIKPPNVMISRSGRVKLADLGIAKADSRFDQLRTSTQETMGTPQYMAPEQFESAAGGTDRADIYAIAAVFVYLLRGDHPITGDSVAQIMKQVVTRGFPDVGRLVPGLPKEVIHLVRSCTAMDPGQRPSVAAVYKQASSILRSFGDGVPLADPAARRSMGTTALPSKLNPAAIEHIRKQLSSHGALAPPPPRITRLSPTIREKPTRSDQPPLEELATAVRDRDEVRDLADRLHRRWKLRMGYKIVAGLLLVATLGFLTLLVPWSCSSGEGLLGSAWSSLVGDDVITNSVGMKLVLIQPGTFDMGSPPNEQG
jgi:serine/threonine-protein kinase